MIWELKFSFFDVVADGGAATTGEAETERSGVGRCQTGDKSAGAGGGSAGGAGGSAGGAGGAASCGRFGYLLSRAMELIRREATGEAETERSGVGRCQTADCANSAATADSAADATAKITVAATSPDACEFSTRAEELAATADTATDSAADATAKTTVAATSPDDGEFSTRAEELADSATAATDTTDTADTTATATTANPDSADASANFPITPDFPNYSVFARGAELFLQLQTNSPELFERVACRLGELLPQGLFFAAASAVPQRFGRLAPRQIFAAPDTPAPCPLCAAAVRSQRACALCGQTPPAAARIAAAAELIASGARVRLSSPSGVRILALTPGAKRPAKAYATELSRVLEIAALSAKELRALASYEKPALRVRASAELAEKLVAPAALIELQAAADTVLLALFAELARRGIAAVFEADEFDQAMNFAPATAPQNLLALVLENDAQNGGLVLLQKVGASASASVSASAGAASASAVSASASAGAGAMKPAQHLAQILAQNEAALAELAAKSAAATSPDACEFSARAEELATRTAAADAATTTTAAARTATAARTARRASDCRQNGAAQLPDILHFHLSREHFCAQLLRDGELAPALHIPLPRDLFELLERIRTDGESGARLLANFAAAHPGALEQNISFKPCGTGICGLWEIARELLGLPAPVLELARASLRMRGMAIDYALDAYDPLAAAAAARFAYGPKAAENPQQSAGISEIGSADATATDATDTADTTTDTADIAPTLLAHRVLRSAMSFRLAGAPDGLIALGLVESFSLLIARVFAIINERANADAIALSGDLLGDKMLGDFIYKNFRAAPILRAYASAQEPPK